MLWGSWGLLGAFTKLGTLSHALKRYTGPHSDHMMAVRSEDSQALRLLEARRRH